MPFVTFWLSNREQGIDHTGPIPSLSRSPYRFEHIWTHQAIANQPRGIFKLYGIYNDAFRITNEFYRVWWCQLCKLNMLSRAISVMNCIENYIFLLNLNTDMVYCKLITKLVKWASVWWIWLTVDFKIE